VPGGALGTVRVVAFACVVLAAALLARPESGDPEERETAARADQLAH
jgi:hypothetical protein